MGPTLPTTRSSADTSSSCRETHSIGRYICNKNKVEAMYPADAQKRAMVDSQLDWQLASLYPCVKTHLYEHIGFAGPSSEADKAAAETKFAEDLWPTLQHFQKKSGGAITLADVFLGIALNSTCCRLPDGFIAKTEVLSPPLTSTSLLSTPPLPPALRSSTLSSPVHHASHTNPAASSRALAHIASRPAATKRRGGETGG